MKTAEQCAAILKANHGDPKPGDMAGCPMGQGGTFIYGGEGDDRVIITGNHSGEHIVVDGGAGRDKVIRSESNMTGLISWMAPDSLGSGALAFVLLAVVAATLVGAVVWRFVSQRERR